MLNDQSCHSNAFAALCEENHIVLDSIQIIAFDLFDTLLYRTVSPQQVHELWAQRLIQAFDLTMTTQKLLQLRRLASRIAKIKQMASGKDRECRYADMMAILQCLLKIRCPFSTFLERSLELEEAVECDVVYVPQDRRNLLEGAKQTGKTVICISDFYLPREWVARLLEHHGLLFENCFISETYALQKASGKLYSKVAAELGCRPQDMLMIGDNQQSDIGMAKQYGLQAIWLDSNAQHGYYHNCNQQATEARRAFYQAAASLTSGQPFRAVSGLMTVFLTRLYRQLRQDGCSYALFMSREGEFFKELFDSYQEQFVEAADRIQTQYFYVSRKATLLPAVHQIQPDSFCEIFKNYPSMSLMTFLKNLGLAQDGSLINRLRARYNMESIVPQFADSPIFTDLMQDEGFCSKIMEQAESQRSLFLNYVETCAPDYREKGLFVVDIGYSGTTQNHLYRIFQQQIRISGYYLFSYSESIAENSLKTGIIFDARKTGHKDAFSYNPVILESVFMASHGGVTGYRLQDNSVVPVLEDNPAEVHCYQTIARPAQLQIKQDVLQLLRLIQQGRLAECDYYSTLRKAYQKFIFNPREAEIQQYMHMVIQDNFSAYRQKQSDQCQNAYGRRYSIKGLALLLKTRGWCLNDQQTNWMAVAFYKLNLWGMNRLLEHLSPLIISLYDSAVRRSVKKRHQSCASHQ